MSKEATKQNLLKWHYDQLHGMSDGRYYKSSLLNPNCLYTSGIRQLYEDCSCYWLHSVLATEFHNALKDNDIADCYYIKLTSNDSEGRIVLSDYMGNVIHERVIEYTDLPEGEITLKMAYDGEQTILCLPKED